LIFERSNLNREATLQGVASFFWVRANVPSDATHPQRFMRLRVVK